MDNMFDASTASIMKVHCNQERKVNPDENPNGQVLGEAFQVLNDSFQREAHDKDGQSGVQPEGMIASMCGMIGSEVYEDWISPLEAEYPDMLNDGQQVNLQENLALTQDETDLLEAVLCLLSNPSPPEELQFGVEYNEATEFMLVVDGAMQSDTNHPSKYESTFLHAPSEGLRDAEDRGTSSDRTPYQPASENTWRWERDNGMESGWQNQVMGNLPTLDNQSPSEELLPGLVDAPRIQGILTTYPNVEEETITIPMVVDGGSLSTPNRRHSRTDLEESEQYEQAEWVMIPRLNRTVAGSSSIPNRRYSSPEPEESRRYEKDGDALSMELFGEQEESRRASFDEWSKEQEECSVASLEELFETAMNSTHILTSKDDSSLQPMPETTLSEPPWADYLTTPEIQTAEDSSCDSMESDNRPIRKGSDGMENAQRDQERCDSEKRLEMRREDQNCQQWKDLTSNLREEIDKETGKKIEQSSHRQKLLQMASQANDASKKLKNSMQKFKVTHEKFFDQLRTNVNSVSNGVQQLPTETKQKQQKLISAMRELILGTNRILTILDRLKKDLNDQQLSENKSFQNFASAIDLSVESFLEKQSSSFYLEPI